LHHLNLVLPEPEWKTTTEEYGVKGIPTAVLIDRDGVIRMEKTGSDQETLRELEDGIKELLKK